MKMSLEEVWQHIPGVITEDMLRFARDEVFGELHRVFVTCVGKNKSRRRMAHCTHCGYDFSGGGMLHNEGAVCPNCHFKSRVFYAWYPTRNCVEYGSMMYWQKSPIDKNTVTAIKLNLKLDMGGSIAQIGVPAIEAEMNEMFVFMHGKGSVRYSRYWNGNWYGVDAIRNPLSNDKCMTSIAEHSFHASVTGTDFERMGVRDFRIWSSIECMDMASRWPSFEYIYKLGFKGLLDEKMNGGFTYGAINWNGKTLVSVLGLTKQDINEIRSNKIHLEYSALYILRRMRKAGERTTVSEATSLDYDLRVFGKADLDEMFRFGNIRRVYEYYVKQKKIKGEDGRQRYYSVNDVHRDYKDYLSQCTRLELDRSDTAIRWPTDLHQAHQNLTVQVKYKENAELDEKVKQRAKELNGYRFSWQGILMRPFMSPKEVVDEGQALSHCVGMYAKRYADGLTILCALRHEEAPDTPWHTVEFTTSGKLVQCRGLRNRTSEEDEPLLDAFWAAFEEHRTKKVRKSA